MENSGGERRVDHTADVSPSPLGLLGLLIARLAEPAAVLNESLTVVAANDAFEALGSTDRQPVGEPVGAVVPGLSAESVETAVDAAGEYVPVRTGDGRWTEFGFDRHGAHVLCVGRTVESSHRVGARGGHDRQALIDLQTATRDLLAAESREAVADHIVGTATDVLGLSGATLYLFDPCRNVLWPAGLAGAPGADDREAVGGDSDGVVREVFLAGTATTAAVGDRYQPLGEYGVLHTVTGADAERGERRHPGQRDEQAGGSAALLAESARAALERLDREATLRERDASHREQTERIDELERTLSVVRRVHRALTDADTVAEVEEGVCTALTASSWLSFAWVGGVTEGAVEPRAWAGDGADYLEAVTLSTGDPHAPPAVRTAATDQSTAVDAVAEGIRDRNWRTAAIARDFQAALSVPLRADSVDYGVLSVYADRPVEWDESLLSVFTELADSVAGAVRDRERQTRLAADAAVELDLSVTAPDAPLGRLAAALGETVGCTEAIPVDRTTARLFVSVPGVDGDSVGEAVDGVEHVDAPETASAGDCYELLVDEATVLGRVVCRGARLDTACLTGSEMALTVTLPADADVRTFVDRLSEGCERVQLTARRTQPTVSSAGGGIRESLEAALTDRQLEALRTAYGSGFFEWPRETTGEGVAEMLGVAQPTVNRHLRVSQRKLLELVFDGE